MARTWRQRLGERAVGYLVKSAIDYGTNYYQSMSGVMPSWSSYDWRGGFDPNHPVYGVHRATPRVITPVTLKNKEIKFGNFSYDDVVIAINGNIVAPSIFLIPQGFAEQQRIGRRVHIVGINIRYNFTLFTTAAPTNTTEVVRFMVILDKQANGAAPVITDVLKTDDYQSFNNLANKGRFKVLLDKMYTLNHTSGAYDGGTDRFGDIDRTFTYFKRCYIPVEFDGVDGLIGELKSNNVFYILLTKVGNRAEFNSRTRIRFVDG